MPRAKGQIGKKNEKASKNRHILNKDLAEDLLRNNAKSCEVRNSHILKFETFLLATNYPCNLVKQISAPCEPGLLHSYNNGPIAFVDISLLEKFVIFIIDEESLTLIYTKQVLLSTVDILLNKCLLINVQGFFQYRLERLVKNITRYLKAYAPHKANPYPLSLFRELEGSLKSFFSLWVMSGLRFTSIQILNKADCRFYPNSDPPFLEIIVRKQRFQKINRSVRIPCICNHPVLSCPVHDAKFLKILPIDYKKVEAFMAKYGCTKHSARRSLLIALKECCKKYGLKEDLLSIKRHLLWDSSPEELYARYCEYEKGDVNILVLNPQHIYFLLCDEYQNLIEEYDIPRDLAVIKDEHDDLWYKPVSSISMEGNCNFSDEIIAFSDDEYEEMNMRQSDFFGGNIAKTNLAIKDDFSSSAYNKSVKSSWGKSVRVRTRDQIINDTSREKGEQIVTNALRKSLPVLKNHDKPFIKKLKKDRYFIHKGKTDDPFDNPALMGRVNIEHKKCTVLEQRRQVIKIVTQTKKEEVLVVEKVFLEENPPKCKPKRKAKCKAKPKAKPKGRPKGTSNKKKTAKEKHQDYVTFEEKIVEERLELANVEVKPSQNLVNQTGKTSTNGSKDLQHQVGGSSASGCQPIYE